MLLRRTIAAAAVVLGVGLAAGPAQAKDGDRTVAGTCSKASTSKLKLKPRPGDGRLEYEFEVDQNKVGQVWKVTVRDNGVAVVSRQATTVAPSGSFAVKGRRPQATGHFLVAVASNAATGERCTARGSV